MAEIPGWFDWQPLYTTAVEQAVEGARFVELGTFFGRSADFLARAILASGKTLHFDTWDNWAGVPPEFDLPGWVGEGHPTEELVRRTLAGLPVHVHTGDALAAARCYADHSLDLVFLDDNHEADHVYRECLAWWPKVRPGGILAGHDYDWPSVQEGVDRWADEMGFEVDAVCGRSWQRVKA